MPLVYTNGIVFCVSYGAQMALEKQQNQIHLSKTSSSCGCSSVPSQEYSTPSEPVTKKSQWVSYYHIPRMDCAAEEQMVRMALASYADDIQELHFDLPARHLAIYHSVQAEKITQSLQRLGLGAELQQTQPHYEPVEKPKRVRASSSNAAQKQVLQWLLLINGVMFVIELMAGIIASSTGLIADSLDMFADAAIYGIALFVVGKNLNAQLKAAHLSGWFQFALAMIVLIDVLRRFIYGSEPVSILMILIGGLALAANISCLYLMKDHKESGAHMKASYIFSANDVIVNLGVIVAGILVAMTGSRYPDLIIGLIIVLFVLNGARKILQLKNE
ncbi:MULTISPECIES: cation transporter [Acinetobacter calcoaceticus/baumannii complex]|uniref:cation transporter n=1 Tax=Acinetobacter calcoaceticus/baumannii complex TaxID=909768 RepID=UPI001BC8734D|nr:MULTISPECIES: cation transporter [Acinetobacter calcoaceticus/baumannii complex]QWZ60386.1 cation transporter [Acinetobacter pittii]